MAKKKSEKPENEGIGSLMSGKMSVKERNLKLKAELIASGEIDEVTIEKMGTVKERNLYMKAQLIKDGHYEEPAKSEPDSESSND